MTLEDLKKRIAERLAADGNQHITMNAVDAVLHGLVDVATQALVDGEEVSLPKLGKIVVRQRAASTGRRNPRTGAPISVPARRAAVLEPSSVLKKALNATGQEG